MIWLLVSMQVDLQKLLNLPLHTPLSRLHASLKLVLNLGHLFPNQESNEVKRSSKPDGAEGDQGPRTNLRSDQGASYCGCDQR